MLGNIERYCASEKKAGPIIILAESAQTKESIPKSGVMGGRMTDSMARRTMARRTVNKPELIIIIVCVVFGLRQYNLIRTFFFTEVSSQNNASGVNTSSSSSSLPRQCTIEELGVIKRQLPPDDCVEYATQPWTQRCSLSYATRCKTTMMISIVFKCTLFIMNLSCSFGILFLSLIIYSTTI